MRVRAEVIGVIRRLGLFVRRIERRYIVAAAAAAADGALCGSCGRCRRRCRHAIDSCRRKRNLHIVGVDVVAAIAIAAKGLRSEECPLGPPANVVVVVVVTEGKTTIKSTATPQTMTTTTNAAVQR